MGTAPVRNRVRGIAELPSARVELSPGNWRTHGGAQRGAMAALFGKVGSVSELVTWIPDDKARRALRASPGPEGFVRWLAKFSGTVTVRVLDGNMRKKLRGKSIGVQVTDLDAREAALVLATFDPMGALAGRDDAALDELLGAVKRTADVDELLALLGVAGEAAPKSDHRAIVEALDAPDAPPFPDAPSPSVDDVLAGRARWALVEGDALAMLRALPDACADALITDEPYSSGGAFRGDRMASTTAKYVQSGQRKKTQSFTGDTRDQRSFVTWCAIWLAEALRVLKVGAPVCLFADWRQLPAVTDAFQAGGLIWRGIVPWDKGLGVRPQKGRFQAQAEYVVWGSAGPMPFERGVGAIVGAYTIPIALQDKFHQTGKPVELMRKVNAIAVAGGLILDPFFGSGSTGAAALVDGYRVIGCEKVKAIASIARGRLAFVERSIGGGA